ncbi:MAG: hypothetical protein FJ098_03640 [Deltaproteobacteria bacterium]|nr:hypothetical protein [Deltaproteobacteria bacterium]
MHHVAQRVREMMTSTPALLLSLALFAGCSRPERILLTDGLGEDALAGDWTAGPDGMSAPDLPTPEDLAPADRQAPREDVPVPDGILPPDPCCSETPDCAAGEVCVAGEDGDGSSPPPPADGQCFYASDCGPDQACVGSMACGCNVDCMSEPGLCTALEPGCCVTDADCPEGLRCVGGDRGAGGVCHPLPEPGACYDDVDCGFGNFCVGSDICSCDMNCISMPGDCVPGQGGCCMSDDACDPGYVCAIHTEGVPTGGVCEPAPYLPGQCWNDVDCGPGKVCLGAWSCPCNADCDGWDKYGFCSSGMEGCCNQDGDCPPDLVCVGWELGDAITGTCQAPPAFGECYYDSDCFEMSQQCVGATVCACNMPCAAPTAPGQCSPLPDGCCYTDTDCKEDEVCRGIQPGSNMPGSCKPDFNQMVGCPPPGGCCWGDEDCPSGKPTCVGAQVCGCIELCFTCGDCAPDQYGICQ